MHFSLTIFTQLLAKLRTITSFMWVTLTSPLVIGLQPCKFPFDSLSIPNPFLLNVLHTYWFFCMKHQSFPVHVHLVNAHTHLPPHISTQHTYTTQHTTHNTSYTHHTHHTSIHHTYIAHILHIHLVHARVLPKFQALI